MIALTMALGITRAAYSQNVGGGASLGMVMSQVDGDRYGGYKKIGWQLGGYAWYDFNDRWALQPELMVTNRGSREIAVNYRLSMTYIDVPVMINFHALPAKGDRLLVQAGPSIGYLLQAKHGWSPYKNDVVDRFTKVDLEGQVGVAYKIAGNVSLFARVGKSFNDNRNRNNPLTPGYTTHNHIMVGVRVHGK